MEGEESRQPGLPGLLFTLRQERGLDQAKVFSAFCLLLDSEPSGC